MNIYGVHIQSKHNILLFVIYIHIISPVHVWQYTNSSAVSQYYNIIVAT